MIAALLWKATAILVLALLAVRLARCARASTRHAMLLAAFALLALLPIAIAALPPLNFPILPGSDRPPVLAMFVTPSASGTATTSTPTAQADRPRVASTGAGFSSSLLLQTLVSVWGTGTILVLGSLALGIVRVQRVRRTALPYRGARPMLSTLTTRAHIAADVDLVVHDDIRTPMTCGTVRHAIVLPPDASGWSDAELTRALVHELEHVSRRDWVTQVFARAICALYWFHPLVWMAYRQLCLEAEYACDDAVVAREEHTMYADQLVTLARRLATAPPIASLGMAHRSDLSARVTAVLDHTRPRGRTGARRATAIAVAAACVLTTLAPLRLVAASTSSALEAPSALVVPNAPQGPSQSRLDRALVEAADEGDIDDVRALLDRGGNVNAAVDGDGSPLIAAARAGHLELVTLLLDRGADVNLAVSGDGAPLLMAAREGHVDIVRLLLDRGADIHLAVADDENALIQASGSGRLAVVRLLVERGADVNAQLWAGTAYDRTDGEWRTPLSVAIRGGYRDVAAFLRAQGAVR